MGWFSRRKKDKTPEIEPNPDVQAAGVAVKQAWEEFAETLDTTYTVAQACAACAEDRAYSDLEEQMEALSDLYDDYVYEECEALGEALKKLYDTALKDFNRRRSDEGTRAAGGAGVNPIYVGMAFVDVIDGIAKFAAEYMENAEVVETAAQYGFLAGSQVNIVADLVKMTDVLKKQFRRSANFMKYILGELDE